MTKCAFCPREVTEQLTQWEDYCEVCVRAQRRRATAAEKAQATKAARQNDPEKRVRFIGGHDITREEYLALLVKST